MDGISTSQQNLQPPMEGQPLPKERKAGVFGLLFVIGAAIILLFLVLNYFNILKLSEIFPNYFGFLPHKEQVNQTIPQPTQTRDNYSPNIFQYDTGKAKIVLTEYIKDNIRPELIPENLEIKQGLSIDKRVEDLKYQFGSYFTTDQATISVSFHYKENTDTPNDFSIFIQPTNLEKTTLTPDLANSLVASYFNTPYSSITNCDKKGTTFYCEEFRNETDGKKGYGVVFSDETSVSPPKFTPIVFTCFVPKDSKDYATLKSCISL